MTSETIANETSSSFVLSFSPIGKTWNYGWLYRAFSCYIIAAMLEGKNNTFSLLWEIRSIFMQNCFIVSALQHGCRENPLYILPFVNWSTSFGTDYWWQLFNNIYFTVSYFICIQSEGAFLLVYIHVVLLLSWLSADAGLITSVCLCSDLASVNNMFLFVNRPLTPGKCQVSYRKWTVHINKFLKIQRRGSWTLMQLCCALCKDC